jgi:hypothetical protein
MQMLFLGFASISDWFCYREMNEDNTLEFRTGRMLLSNTMFNFIII